jgi:hypothetical protein
VGSPSLLADRPIRSRSAVRRIMQGAERAACVKGCEVLLRHTGHYPRHAGSRHGRRRPALTGGESGLSAARIRRAIERESFFRYARLDTLVPPPQTPAVLLGATLQRPCGGTEIVPILPAFTGSGKFMVGRPSTTSPNTSTDAAPYTWVPPSQVTERVGADFPPQAASGSRMANQASRCMRLPPRLGRWYRQHGESAATAERP